MKRLLVLGAASGSGRWLEGQLSHIDDPVLRRVQAQSFAESPGVDCDGLLVVDDGGQAGFAALRSALVLRERQPGLPIAVVTALDRDWSDQECLTRSRCRTSAKAQDKKRLGHAALRDLMRAGGAEFEVNIAADAITFEYHEEPVASEPSAAACDDA